MFSAIVVEALEDFGLVSAMREAEDSQIVSEKEVMKVLKA